MVFMGKPLALMKPHSNCRHGFEQDLSKPPAVREDVGIGKCNGRRPPAGKKGFLKSLAPLAGFCC
jgi:hypothetical protein